MTVVQQTIKDRGGNHGVAEDRAPLADTAVAGQQDRASLIATANELEEQMRGIGFKGQIPELVDDQELWLGKLRESLLEPPFAVTFSKLRNDSRGCDELNGMPSQDRFATKSDRKMGLANARRTSVIMPGV